MSETNVLVSEVNIFMSEASKFSAGASRALKFQYSIFSSALSKVSMKVSKRGLIVLVF